MKKLASLFLACALSGLFPASSAAEEWAYTGWYPYVCLYSTGGWIYEPANPPLVWDYTVNDWAPNPLGGRSFDLRKTFDKFPLQLDMTLNGYPAITMQICFNFSGVDTSIVSYTREGYPEISGEVYTRYSLDACAGTLLMLGSFPSGENFALDLDFQTATTGTYKMIGLYPFFAYTMEVANHLGTLSGSFTLGEYIGECPAPDPSNP